MKDETVRIEPDAIDASAIGIDARARRPWTGGVPVSGAERATA